MPDVVFCVDDHFTLPCAVAMLSLAESGSFRPRLNVISAQSDDGRQRLAALGRHLGFDLRLAAFDRALPFQNVMMYGRPTTAAYARLFIAEYFPDLDRCLYLDADILCRKDLSPLFEMDLQGAVLGAARDPTFFGVEEFLEIFGGRYFNSGVLLMDLARWRKIDATERAVQAVHFFEAQALPHQFWDQSPLNLALRGEFTELAPRWNMSIHHQPEMAGFYGLDAETFETQRRDPAIVHFLGNEKPWKPGFEVMNDWARHWQDLRRELDGS